MMWLRVAARAVFFFVVVVVAGAGAGAGGVAFFAAAGGVTSSLLLLPGVDTAVKAAHLLCFATSWGATVWAIYVGGLVMFLNLPRHMMGRLRGKVFPACFALSAACTAASAAAFAWLHRPWEAAAAERRRQLGILVAVAGLDLANLLLFTPRTLKMMQERHKVERGLGIGDRGSLDGWRSNARAAGTDNGLAAANMRFRAAHVPSAVAIVASTSGLAAHSWYLAGKLAL